MVDGKWMVGALSASGVLVALTLTGKKSVTAARVIPYPAEAIWALLMETSQYREWNPILVSAEGQFEPGGTIRYQMKTSDGTTTPVEPLVRRLVAEREINQFGGLRGVLTFNHTWRLEPVAGGTRVTQHEEYRGIGVWFWNPAWVEEAYRKGLAALDARLGEDGQSPSH